MGEPLAGASDLGILEDLRRKKLGKNSQRMEDFYLELQVNNYLRFLISFKVYVWAISLGFQLAIYIPAGEVELYLPLGIHLLGE